MSQSFLPTRDLCSLRPLLLPSVAKSLHDLTEAARLGREAQVVIDCNNDEEQIDDDQLRTDLNEDGEAQSDSSQDGAEEMIERRFAQTWLIKFISADVSKLDVSASEAEDLYALHDQAGSILAALCGNSASHLQTTRFIFRHPSQTGDSVAVRIRDSPVTADALGNRTWGAAPLLSRKLVTELLRDNSDCTDVLELGAGTGLVGLAVTAALRGSAPNSSRPRRVDLTDYHPHVLKTLQDNVRLNGFDQGEGVEAICHVARLDWQEVHEEQMQGDKVIQDRYTSTAQTVPNTESCEEWPRIDPNAQYDLIIAADCIYDPHHPAWIKSVAQRHLDRSRKTSRLLLMSPLRSTHQAEMTAIHEAFPTAPDSSAVPSIQLQIVHEKQEIGYDDFGPQNFSFDGNGGERSRQRGLKSRYRLFEIRWVGEGTATSLNVEYETKE